MRCLPTLLQGVAPSAHGVLVICKLTFFCLRSRNWTRAKSAASRRPRSDAARANETTCSGSIGARYRESLVKWAFRSACPQTFKKVIHAAQSKRSSDNIKKLQARQDAARQKSAAVMAISRTNRRRQRIDSEKGIQKRVPPRSLLCS